MQNAVTPPTESTVTPASGKYVFSPDRLYTFEAGTVYCTVQVLSKDGRKEDLKVACHGNTIYLDAHPYYVGTSPMTTEVDPFITVSCEDKVETRQARVKAGRWSTETKLETLSYRDPTKPQDNTRNSYLTGFRNPTKAEDRLPYYFQKVTYTAPDGATYTHSLQRTMPTFGDVTLDKESKTWSCVSTLADKTHTWRGPVNLVALRYHTTLSNLQDSLSDWWDLVVPEGKHVVDDKGLKAVLKQKKKQEFWDAVKADDVVWRFFQFLTNSKTSNKTSNNKLLKASIEAHGWTKKGGEAFAAELRSVMGNGGHENFASIFQVNGGGGPYHYRTDEYLREQSSRTICMALSGAQDAVQEAEAAHDHRKARTAEMAAQTLGITSEAYPTLHGAICAGEWPTGVFNNPDGQPVNREFPLIELALKKTGWKDPLCEIAQDAARRGTYEKELTPYINFMLFKLPKYLDRHTPGRQKWSCMPKFVSSQWELEMDEAEEGTTKKRSAFTPVADNDTRVVTVPYVAVAVSGIRTTWCYSREYHVLEEGMTCPFSKGVVMNDYEEALNGRDDYGMMYYTLTGSNTSRGYPTFLIIFERLNGNKTHVHFHRVHPKRKDKGHWRPISELVESGYKYMAGNVEAAEIAAQQGDMIYIPYEGDPLANKVKTAGGSESSALGFESHVHISTSGENITLMHSDNKQRYLLGYMKVPEGGMRVEHPEHDDIDYLSEGWYKVNRCRSFEANPRAIWSVTID